MLSGTLLLLLLPQGTEDALSRFRALDPDRQQTVLHRLERQVMLDPDPALQRIVSMSRSFERYRAAEPRGFHDPETWARGVAPPRVMIPAGSEEHMAVRVRIPAIAVLPDLHTAVTYDWGRGFPVRREQRLRADEVFANCLSGYPPGADEALARILEALDRDPGQRQVAAYLDHLYADLDAKVYAGITIYEAWFSEQVMDVPDVDAIPFAREILGTTAYRSPIPAGRRRTALYQKISEAAFSHRVYRTLREAAAFLSADPEIDPTYRPWVTRFHYLFHATGHDPEKLADLLQEAGTRDALLQRVDQVIETPEAYEVRQRVRAELRTMALRVRRLALQALDDR